MTSRLFVRIIVKNSQEEVLVLLEERKQPLGTRELIWNFPGGRVDPGESFIDAARRELLEETGLAVVHLTQLAEIDFRDSTGLWNGVFYYADNVIGSPKRREIDKCIEMRFVSSDQLAQLPGDRELLHNIAALHSVRVAAPSLL